MSKAYKCDRCGKLYEGYKVAPKDMMQLYADCKSQDLCKECHYDLKSWFLRHNEEVED